MRSRCFISKEIPHNKGGWLASEFSVMRACKFRRLAGGKSSPFVRYFPNTGTENPTCLLPFYGWFQSSRPLVSVQSCTPSLKEPAGRQSRPEGVLPDSNSYCLSCVRMEERHPLVLQTRSFPVNIVRCSAPPFPRPLICGFGFEAFFHPVLRFLPRTPPVLWPAAPRFGY